uniref:RUN domain-containing protein n=1 Tax=Romanomermis culicivorax TaxID=13658 RepID=A0A915JF07_ROMCU
MLNISVYENDEKRFATSDEKVSEKRLRPNVMVLAFMVKRDFQSVYSRLILCKTFRLDEDGKVLTADELLYKSVQQINTSHNQHKVQMDVKFRSLICLGLNEQVLHLWWELLCSNQPLVDKYYQPWSFVRSPGWVQIKCELRLLTQFAFRLSVDWELPLKASKAVDQPLKEGVRDICGVPASAVACCGATGAAFLKNPGAVLARGQSHGPGVPRSPAGPCCPTGPGLPGAPSGPGSPGVPCPDEDGLPSGPGCPVGPAGPGWPCAPGTPG